MRTPGLGDGRVLDAAARRPAEVGGNRRLRGGAAGGEDEDGGTYRSHDNLLLWGRDRPAEGSRSSTVRSGGDAGCPRRPYGPAALWRAGPIRMDAMPARARGQVARTAASTLARINAANAGDNWAIQWPG